MKAFDFIRNWFSKEEIVSVGDKTESQGTAAAIQQFAMDAAVNMTAAMLSKVCFRTYRKEREILDAESYLWNVEPNPQQNAAQFWRELTEHLFLYGEALAVEYAGGIYLADTYDKAEDGVTTVFRNICRNGKQLYSQLSSKDVLLFEDYGQQAAHLLSGMNSQYSELLSMAKSKYRRSGGRKVIVEVVSTAAGSRSDEATEQKNLQSRFQNFFESENAAMKVPRGTKYTDVTGEAGKKTTSELNDVTKLIEDIFSRTAQRCGIPVSLFMGNTAGTKELMNDWITYRIEPLAKMIQTEINRKRYGLSSYRKGDRIQADTTCLIHVELFEIAQSADKLISSGISSIDELRERAGQAPCGEWWSMVHWMTKNYTQIDRISLLEESGKGGKNLSENGTNFKGRKPG
ncbi:MAG: phage portal protein [Massiliimalia sp.]